MNIVSIKNLNFTHIAQFAVFAVFVCLKTHMNVKSAKNLEFIQTTRSVEFTLDYSSFASLSGEGELYSSREYSTNPPFL